MPRKQETKAKAGPDKMTPAEALHRAKLRAFLAGKTTAPRPGSKTPKPAGYSGSLKLNRF